MAILNFSSLEFYCFGGIKLCASLLNATHLRENVQYNSLAITHRPTNMVLHEKHLRDRINRKKGVPRNQKME
jgi:hypothetical protein